MKKKTIDKISISVLLSIALTLFLTTIGTAAPGDLDPTFGIGGKLTDWTGAANAVVIQPDGKIVAVGLTPFYVFAVARYNADGSPDATFGNAGRVSFPVGWFGHAFGIDAAIQSDGKIVVTCYDDDQGYGAIVRLNANGSLDTSFGSNGMVNTVGAHYSVAIQPDGKIITSSRIGRYNSNGSVDTTFGTGGVTDLEIFATAVVLQSDGKIVAAGAAGQASLAFAVARLNADGTADQSFGTGGLATAPITPHAFASSVSVQSDGKIVAVGNRSTVTGFGDYSLVRYNANGSLDTTFDNDGIVRLAVCCWSYFTYRHVVALNDGKILVSGSALNGSNYDFAIARYNSNGSLDTTFGGGDGIATVDFNNSNDFANGMALDSQGRAVVVGVSDGFALARFLLADAGGPTPTPTPTPSPTPSPTTTPTPTPTPTQTPTPTPTPATLTVTNTNDSGPGSLRQAIANAEPGSTINFDATVFANPQTITLTSGQLVIDKNLTIQGPGAGLLSISANHASRVLRINIGVTAALDGLTIKDGAVSIDGGGGVYNGGTLTVSNSSITGNATTVSAVHGGGILSAGTLNLNRSTVSGNVAGDADGHTFGGGIYNVGVMNITYSTVSNNISDGGGGITNGDGGTMTVINSTISGNSVDGLANFGTLTVSYSSISGNTTDKFGSGISNRGVAVVTTSTISYNIGEGIFSNGTMTVANSTLSRNTTGIRFSPSDSGSILAVSNSTVFGNLGFGIYNGNGFGNAVTLMNTIVAGNSVAGGAGDIYGTAIGSASHNLIGDAGSSGGIQNGVNGNIVGVNPLLGPLRNNGGPTMTHALRPASPAINTGDNCVLTQNGCGYGNPALTTDQRGMPRNGMVDIGAFERQLVESSSSAPFDYDGDGKTDISVHRWTTGTWYVARSLTNDMYVKPFDEGAQTMMPADYDGDGITDIAISSEYNPPETYMALVILNSSTNTVSVRPFDAYGQITLAADFDGDGRADPTTWSGFGSWKIDMSQSGTVYTQQWGVAGDKAVPADFDGDGKAELAVWRPSEGKWYVANIATGSITTINWGVDGDIPVPGDYNGDGRADFAVYRPSNNTWYRLHSNDYSIQTTQWGQAGDIVTPGDYDGDGKIDVAVFRPSNGTWYIVQSSAGIRYVQFGQAGDTPTQTAFTY